MFMDETASDVNLAGEIGALIMQYGEVFDEVICLLERK
jgi:hypothetical protein